MGDLGAAVRFLGDADELIERFKNPHRLGPHMADLNAVVGGRGFGQLDEFLGLGEGARHIDQTGAQSHCAVLHRLNGDSFHHRELFCVWSTDETAAHALLTHGAIANECGDVQSHLGLLDFCKQLRYIGARVAAVSCDDGGDAHTQKILRSWNAADHFGVRVDVDEAWRGHFAARVDDLICRALNWTCRNDFSGLYRDAARDQWRSAAVGDPCVCDEEIKIRRRGRADEQKGEKQKLHGSGKDVAHGTGPTHEIEN